MVNWNHLSGEHRRIQFVECPNNVNGNIRVCEHFTSSWHAKGHGGADISWFVQKGTRSMEFLIWQASNRLWNFILCHGKLHDLMLVDRVLMDNGCNRNIVLYGYLRGCDIKKQSKVHIAGVVDFSLLGVTSLLDLCPLLAAL